MELITNSLAEAGRMGIDKERHLTFGILDAASLRSSEGCSEAALTVRLALHDSWCIEADGRFIEPRSKGS